MINPQTTRIAPLAFLRWTRAAVTAVFLIVLGCAGSASQSIRAQQAAAAKKARQSPACVAIVGTNDIHGTILPEVVTDKKTGRSVRRGGFLALSGYVAILKSQYGERMLLLDGGDIYQGTMVSNMSYGKAMIAGFNAMGYTAAAIGNHEFDFGAGDQQGKVGADHFAVIKGRIAEARFPFLAANVVESATDAPLSWLNVRPSMVIKKPGMTIGIVGALTMDTPAIVSHNLIDGVEMRDPVERVRREADALRAAGAEMVVLVAHLGGKCGQWNNPQEIASCGQDEEMFRLLNALPRGTIDVAVGGHTHAELGHSVNGTATIESGARGRAFVWVEACVAGPKNQRRYVPERTVIHAPMRTCLETWANGTCDDVAAVSAAARATVQPAQFMGKPIVPDVHVTTALQPYLDNVQAAFDRPINVQLSKPMTRDAHPPADNIGHAVAASIAKAGKTAIGIQNRGGTRDDLAAGQVRYGNVFEVLPFDNKVATLQLTGDQLQRMVEILTTRANGKPPYMMGLVVKTKRDGTLQITGPDGQTLRSHRRYAVATNDFLAHGAEGLDKVFSEVPADQQKYTDILLRDALVTWLQQHASQPAVSPSKRPH